MCHFLLQIFWMSCKFSQSGFDSQPDPKKSWRGCTRTRHPSFLPGVKLVLSSRNIFCLLGRALGLLFAPTLAWSWWGDRGSVRFQSARKSLHCEGACSQAGGGGRPDGGESSEFFLQAFFFFLKNIWKWNTCPGTWHSCWWCGTSFAVGELLKKYLLCTWFMFQDIHLNAS